jgi:hypothetical protein
MGIVMADGESLQGGYRPSASSNGAALHDALTPVAPDQIRRFTLSAADRTLYYGRLSVESDLWLADLPP